MSDRQREINEAMDRVWRATCECVRSEAEHQRAYEEHCAAEARERQQEKRKQEARVSLSAAQDLLTALGRLETAE